MKSALSRTWLAVIGTSLILAFANSAAFFYGLFTQPAGTVYLGTVHYWEDFFFYLNHFYQGAHGAWLVANRYTTEVTNPSIVYWCNLMLGKIGGWLFMPPLLSYNVSLLLLAFAALILSFVVSLRAFANHRLALIAFLTGNLATSLINRVISREGPMVWWPFQIWRTPHFALDRLGGAPHQLVQTILSYLFFLGILAPVRAKHPYRTVIGCAVCLVLLTTLNPIQAVFYAGILWLMACWGTVRRLTDRTLVHDAPPAVSPMLRESMAWKRVIPMTVPALMTAAYMNAVLSQEPHIQSKLWEASQHSYTTPGFLILSLGPVVILAAIGCAARWRKWSVAEAFGMIAISLGYGIFFSRIPQQVGISNLRFLHPATSVFWGILASRGLEFLAGRFHRFSGIRVPVGSGAILAIYLLISLPTLLWELHQKLPKQQDYRDPLVFMPLELYEGFVHLDSLPDTDAAVLADPAMHMDTVVPALSGHTVYSGHMLTTIDNAGKQKIASEFFRGTLGAGDARLLMRSHGIVYVLSFATPMERSRLKDSYPFLIPVFGNASVGIYRSE